MTHPLAQFKKSISAQGILFCKMHGLGNDFVVLDGISADISLKNLSIEKLADRHQGIGFDQLLLILPSTNADFACRIFNADGTEAEQCGNGMRAVARYVHENQLTKQTSFTIETKAGIVQASLKDYDHIQINMGAPSFELGSIPFITEQTQDLYQISIDGVHAEIALSVLSMGNPHAILSVDSLDNFPVAAMGSKIAAHSSFPESVNVGFMEILSPEHIRLRTFERGAGETLACGSNACAAVVSGILNHSLANRVKVELPLGVLWIEWSGKSSPVLMTGPAVNVFYGVI